MVCWVGAQSQVTSMEITRVFVSQACLCTNSFWPMLRQLVIFPHRGISKTSSRKIQSLQIPSYSATNLQIRRYSILSGYFSWHLKCFTGFFLGGLASPRHGTQPIRLICAAPLSLLLNLQNKVLNLIRLSNHTSSYETIIVWINQSNFLQIIKAFILKTFCYTTQKLLTIRDLRQISSPLSHSLDSKSPLGLGLYGIQCLRKLYASVFIEI